MILADDVHKSYTTGGRRIDALRGVCLDIREAGFFGIMGASGSGKSTLLHLLAALDRPDSGELTVAGKRIDKLSDRELTLFRRHEIGIVFQQFNLISTMSARENVELPGVLAGQNARTLRDRSTHLMETLGVIDRATHRPDALSGGEQQRVAIARALMFSPRVLLADEPTGNLDSRSSEKLWTLLETIAKDQALSIVMVTHEPSAAAHCERVFILSDGRITGHIDTEGIDASDLATQYQRLSRAS
ncbi:ABC transporter ATP-binding protein [Planctomycetaceae bacterium AH-315-I19]|nr:ABC transporter ATP-binding protein [Planctomycetaceae bacterium AH-315-I19]